MNISINKEELEKLLKSFYELAKIRIVFFDCDFNEIFGYPAEYSKFCHVMRENSAFKEKCDISAERMCRRCAEENKLITTTCHAGLTEAVAPLTKDNITMGYIMFGQIRGTKDKDEFLQNVKALCSSFGANADAIEKLAPAVHYKSTEQIKAAAEIVNVFISYIYMKEIINIRKDGAAYLIMNYIEENLANSLTVNEICKKFLVSRTSFYELTKPHMPNGIAAYIRERRLEKAKKLLTDTDKTVDEIAGETGFNDGNYFRRVFKKHTGIPANKYRK